MPPARRRLAAVAAGASILAAAGAAPALAAPDPLLADQWALSQPRAVGAAEAWTQSQGQGVVVAVLDSGVQLDHPDLKANLWSNAGEVAGNRRDDDGNGYVDDVHGANLFSGNGHVADDEGHGTHVAGIVAARAGNGTGGSGLAPQARIMAVKVLDSTRSGDSATLAAGIRYAVDEGARILNVSINGDATTSDLTSALRYAGQKGATIVASAGNNSRNLDLQPSFPAASTEPAVLSVTAAGESGGLLDFANRGLTTVDLAAPGDTILSTARASGYENRSGTSMAAPFVAGGLALLAAARPDMSQAALRGALMSSAPRRGGLAGLLGSGGLDVGAAMHAVLPGDMWRTTATGAQVGQPRLRLRTGGRVRAGGRATLRWSASGAGAVARWHVQLDGRRIATRGPSAAAVVRRRISRAGRHRWRVVGLDGRGARIVVATRGFRVLPRG
jgi:subtilisin family serine protease